MELRPLPIGVCGFGAVSPAGWGAAELVNAARTGRFLPFEEGTRAQGAPTVRARRVPPPQSPLAFAREPRLRRSSAIAQFATAAALEALGTDRAAAAQRGALRLGVIFNMMNGCVNFSRRFYSEVLADPHSASPLIFPETVFNAPSSHLAALLDARHNNYTLVGDSAQFVASLDLAAQWLEGDEVDGCLVVGAEEFDWLTAEAAALFDRSLVVTEGAAALYFERSGRAQVQLTGPHIFTSKLSRRSAAERVRAEMASAMAATSSAVLFDGLSGSGKSDAVEAAVWSDWKGARVSVKKNLGDGFGAAAGWQCVAAAAALASGECQVAAISAPGTNQQAVGALIFS
ncbi:MAG: hypothetical protein ACR2OZ_15010 [Verrucomicrobiales bacterium]